MRVLSEERKEGGRILIQTESVYMRVKNAAISKLAVFLRPSNPSCIALAPDYEWSCLIYFALPCVYVFIMYVSM